MSTACAISLTTIVPVIHRGHIFQCYVAKNQNPEDATYRICADASSYCGISVGIRDLKVLPADRVDIEALIISEAQNMFDAQPHYVDLALLNTSEY